MSSASYRALTMMALASAAAAHAERQEMPAARHRPLQLAGVRYDDTGARKVVRADGSPHGRRWNGVRLVKWPANGSCP
jgi:hypothetical protein